MTRQRKRWWLVGAALGVVGALALLVQAQRPDAREIGAKLRATVLPRLSLDGMPCAQAIDLVMNEVRREHPELRHVPVIYRVEPGTKALRVTLQMSDIPADMALKYIGAQTDTGLAFRNKAIYVYTRIPYEDGEPEQVPPLTPSERWWASVQSRYEQWRYGSD